MGPSSIFLNTVIRECLNVLNYVPSSEGRATDRAFFILLFKKRGTINCFLFRACVQLELSGRRRHSANSRDHGWSWNPTKVQRCSMEAPTPNRALRNICGCASITDDSTSEQRSPRVRFSIWRRTT